MNPDVYSSPMRFENITDLGQLQEQLERYTNKSNVSVNWGSYSVTHIASRQRNTEDFDDYIDTNENISDFQLINKAHELMKNQMIRAKASGDIVEQSRTVRQAKAIKQSIESIEDQGYKNVTGFAWFKYLIKVIRDLWNGTSKKLAEMEKPFQIPEFIAAPTAIAKLELPSASAASGASPRSLRPSKAGVKKAGAAAARPTEAEINQAIQAIKLIWDNTKLASIADEPVETLKNKAGLINSGLKALNKEVEQLLKILPEGNEDRGTLLLAAFVSTGLGQMQVGEEWDELHKNLQHLKQVIDLLMTISPYPAHRS